MMKWFDSLPNKYYIFDNCIENYNDKIVEYLWEYHDYYVEKWNNY